MLSCLLRCCLLEEQHIQVLERPRSQWLGRRWATLLHPRGGQDTHQRERDSSHHSSATSYQVQNMIAAIAGQWRPLTMYLSWTIDITPYWFSCCVYVCVCVCVAGSCVSVWSRSFAMTSLTSGQVSSWQSMATSPLTTREPGWEVSSLSTNSQRNTSMSGHKLISVCVCVCVCVCVWLAQYHSLPIVWYM